MLTYKFRSAEPSNVYLPPPTASTESPIIIHPPEDYDMNSYLPPFIVESPPPPSPPENVEPPQSYLPPESVITFHFFVVFFRECLAIFDNINQKVLDLNVTLSPLRFQTINICHRHRTSQSSDINTQNQNNRKSCERWVLSVPNRIHCTFLWIVCVVLKATAVIFKQTLPCKVSLKIYRSSTWTQSMLDANFTWLALGSW